MRYLISFLLLLSLNAYAYPPNVERVFDCSLPLLNRPQQNGTPSNCPVSNVQTMCSPDAGGVATVGNFPTNPAVPYSESLACVNIYQTYDVTYTNTKCIDLWGGDTSNMGETIHNQTNPVSCDYVSGVASCDGTDQLVNGNCESTCISEDCEEQDDPCPPYLRECSLSCENGVKSMSCNSSNGAINGTPNCVCNTDQDRSKGFCNGETGVGCATDLNQVEEQKKLDALKGKLGDLDLKLTDIKGILQKSDGTFTDMKTVLTQIANSDGVKNSGAGGGGGETGEVEIKDGDTHDFDSIPSFQGKLTEVKAELALQKTALFETMTNFSEVSGVVQSFGGGGECPVISFSGTYLSSLGTVSLCETPIFTYLRYALLFIAALSSVIILLRKN